MELEVKLEEKRNKRFKSYKKIFDKFNKLKEEKIIELYKKVNTKTDNELNGLPYIEALKYDKRTYCENYIPLIKITYFSF